MQSGTHMRMSNAERRTIRYRRLQPGVQCYTSDQKHSLVEFTRKSSHKSTDTHVQIVHGLTDTSFTKFAEQRTPNQENEQPELFQEYQRKRKLLQNIISITFDSRVE